MIDEGLTWDRITDQRVLALLAGAEYVGCCIVQSPGAWTRLGPTWVHPTHGWITVGVGVRDWGTKEGLGELATSPNPSPEWHAPATAASPAPNAVFFVTAAALEPASRSMIRALLAAANAWMARCE